jgi:hypothetical protein
MLYGHIETVEERTIHLMKLREAQDETGGFFTFIPLAFSSPGTQLEHIPPTTGELDLRVIAVSRLMLDNFPHIKAFWMMCTPPVAQSAQWYGADDIDGTIVTYTITHEIDKDSDSQNLSQQKLVEMILEAGRDPVERDAHYNRIERENMGEIRDAMFRFVMGYMKSQRDIALGRLYENLAGTVASKSEKEGYVQVPSTNIEDTYARRYGKLAGKWVPQEVLEHLTAFDQSAEGDLLKVYRKALSMWKEGKTVLNPVAHANNIMGNLTMAHFAGISYWDAHKYIGAVKDIVTKDPMVNEALEAGLFGGTVSQVELVSMLPDQLKVLAAKTESKVAKGVDFVWSALSLFLRKPLGVAYEAEDLYFRYLIYRDARGRGLPPPPR